MSESKQRTIQEIQQENAGLVYRAGQIQYTIVGHQKDLETINGRLRELNYEYLAAVELDKKIQEKVAEAKTAAAPTEQKAGE